ncbi:hypothetical protein ABZ721_18740 [Streptomyces sp. NPDC006733]|uniref:hypothetical protein n=1 Tax=Streptomyces sp. NPDC006733 TaxID=3155460 RepID=UPI0033C101DE
MADQNLFEQLKAVLAEFKGFLDTNVPTIKPAIKAIAALVPQVNELLTLLVDLMTKLKTEVEHLDVSTIPGLAEASALTGQLPALLEAAKKLLPNETSAIKAIADIADVVTALPSVEAVKTEILALIAAIVAHLNSLKG